MTRILLKPSYKSFGFNYSLAELVKQELTKQGVSIDQDLTVPTDSDLDIQKSEISNKYDYVIYSITLDLKDPDYIGMNYSNQGKNFSLIIHNEFTTGWNEKYPDNYLKIKHGYVLEFDRVSLIKKFVGVDLQDIHKKDDLINFDNEKSRETVIKAVNLFVRNTILYDRPNPSFNLPKNVLIYRFRFFKDDNYYIS